MAESERCSLDQMMEDASRSLAQMDYLGCENQCLNALAVARAQGDWSFYARVLLPLQEARRQRRLTAADGVIRLGSDDLTGDPAAWLGQASPGCVVLTRPHDEQTARQLTQAIGRQRVCVEVLLATNHATASQWTLQAIDGPKVRCSMPAPPSGWVNRWLVAGQAVGCQPLVRGVGQDASVPGAEAVDWFLDACEALGDAALAQVQVPLGDLRRVGLLEDCLRVVADHELLLQALGDAVRALVRPGAGA